MPLKILSYVVLVAVGIFHLQEPRLNWVKFQPPEYPRNAQRAHIQGRVILEFMLRAENAVSIQSSKGHPELVRSAQESLLMSKLACDNCSEQSTRFTVTYDFEVVNHDCNGPDDPPKVTRDSPMHVRVVAQSVCTVDPVARYMKARSWRCLYLWKCALRREE